ncbi:MAG TPA: porin, partial [Burkholderiales bacterium]|nr:porin [Burkholderiales bacterium]
WDQSKTNIKQEIGSGTTAAPFIQGPSSDFKRTAWAAIGTYDTGNHHFQLTYVRADDWSGNLAGQGLSSIDVVPTNLQTAGANTTRVNVGGNTGAKMWSAGYQYNLSQRTNVSLSYQQIRNDSLARYDFFANGNGQSAGAYGADPKSIAVGLRHTW